MTGRSKSIFAALAVSCFCAPSQAGAQGYGGPSLLSRGGNRPGHRGRAPVNFNVYASVRGMYESGLLAPRLDESGEIRSANIYGVQTEAGLYGGRDWRRHSIGIDYRADYRYQTRLASFNGTNQAVSFSSQHRLSRRLMVVLQQTGGTSNRAFGGFAAPFSGSSQTLGVPLNELFDVRTYYLQSAAIVAYQKSARTSLFAGGDIFFVKRQSLSLVNGQGARVQGGVQHRLSRTTSVLLDVGFMRFEYPRVFSNSDIYTAGAGVTRRLSRNLDLTLRGGVFLIYSRGVEAVALSPVVAEILGRSTGAVAFSRVERAPMIHATLGYTQERGRFHLTAMNGVNPGNGVFLTTTVTSVMAGYSYSGVRRMSLGVSGGLNRTRSVVLTLQSFNHWQAGGAMTYQIARYLSFMTQVDRRYFSGSSVQGRSGTSVSVGLAYSPSRFPISIF